MNPKGFEPSLTSLSTKRFTVKLKDLMFFFNIILVVYKLYITVFFCLTKISCKARAIRLEPIMGSLKLPVLPIKLCSLCLVFLITYILIVNKRKFK